MIRSRFVPALPAILPAILIVLNAPALVAQAPGPGGTEPPTARVAVLTASLYNDQANVREATDTAQAVLATAVIRDRLVEQLGALRQGRAIERPSYDFTQHRRLPETVRLEPRQAVIVEGILIFESAALRDLFDIKIFVDTDADLRFIRRLRRDIRERGRTVESVIQQYMSTVRPMHMEFVEPSKRYADVIIPEGGHNEVGIDLVIQKIRSLVPREASARQ